jgi:hypothetical protein
MNLEFWIEEVIRLVSEGQSIKKACKLVNQWRREYES